MMRSFFCAIPAIALLTAGSAWSAPTEGETASSNSSMGALGVESLYLDASGYWGYSGTTAAAGQSAPTLMQFGGGITPGWWLTSDLMVGITSDFRFINQYSDVDAAVGNRRGTRWNLASPTIGYRIWKLMLKGDFQFLGSYSLSNQTPGGQDVAYTGPLGGRLTVLYPVMSRISVGAQFEYLTFGTQSVGGTETELSSNLTLWQGGITASYAF